MIKVEQKNKGGVILSLNPKIYPLKAVYGTCYVFLDRAYVFLDGDPEKEIKVTMKAKEGFTKKQLEEIVGEFSNELLNCTLRNQIAKENLKIREYIIGQALASTIAPPEDKPLELAEISESEADFMEDPLGIAVPWEEKQENETPAKKTAQKTASKKKSAKKPAGKPKARKKVPAKKSGKK